ncbi:MAG: hypothetical protein ACI3Z0_08650 [Candidatus Cryptobacteroides sp.]
MRLKLLISILLLAILLLSCNPFKTATERMDRAENAIETAPEQALASLDSIRRITLITAPRRARYALLMAMTLDKCYIDTTDLNLIMPAVRYYTRKGSPDEKMRTYFYMGNIERNAGNRESAMADYIIADESSPAATDYYTAGLLKSAIAGAYSRDFNSSKELKYMEEAIRFARMAGDTVGVWYYEAQLSESYFNCGILDKSDSLFEAFLTEPILDSLFYADELLSYAKSLVLRDQPSPKRSIDLIKESVRLSGQLTDVSDISVYAYALELTGCRDEADSIIGIASEHYGTEILPSFKYRIYKHRGETDKALEYLEYAVDKQDSIVLKTLEQSMVCFQAEFFKERSVSMQKTVDNEKQTKQIAFLIILLLIALVLVQYMGRKRKYALMEANIASLSKELSVTMSTLTEEINNRETLLEGMRKQNFILLRERFDVIHELCSDFYSPSKANKKDTIYKTVEKEVNKFGTDVKAQRALQMLLDEKMDNVISRMREALPKHNDADYAFISYLIMGFDAKTISLLLGMQVDTVYTKKNRLRREIEALPSEPEKKFLLNCISR